jgi:hypothetical protein
MQQQIEEEIEDEIALADEQYQREKQAHEEIKQKRKIQTIRKVYLTFQSLLILFFYYYRKKQKNV